MTGAYQWNVYNQVVTSAGYVYDGEGQRVQKITCATAAVPCTPSAGGATVTTYVYDAFGNLAAEYGGAGGTPECGNPPCYVTVDHLGSTRLVTDASGNVVSRYDFLPFGEELWAGVNGRTVAMAYHGNEDGFSPKFTGQERDAESGLDYFHARYFSGPEGRFLSGDPGNAGASLGDPRSWNGYAYVGNDPLTLTDPTGESWWSNLLGVLAGIGTFIGAGDPLLGAQVGLGVNDTVDSVAHGQFPAEGLFELLGAAASLGDAGAGGAIGTGGGYGGGSTGGMIFDYNSYEHIRMTLAAGGDFGFAMGVASVDFWRHSQGTDPWHAHWHAMGGLVMNTTHHSWIKPTYHAESACQAYAGAVSALGDSTQRALAGDRSAAEQAVHTIQDSYAGGHQFQFWPGGFPSWSHEKADATYSPNPVEATWRYLQALQGHAPMLGPGSYLYPAPAGCR